jgi:hypothetical protein
VTQSRWQIDRHTVQPQEHNRKQASSKRNNNTRGKTNKPLTKQYERRTKTTVKLNSETMQKQTTKPAQNKTNST